MKIFRFGLTKTVSLLILFLTVSSLSVYGQAKKNTSMMKECCMMKDGKMMVMKDDKTMPMEKDMVMKNGTTCMTNGECLMKDGTKMMMKNGDCMDMSGKMCTDKKNKMKKTPSKKIAAMDYSCPMHPEVTSNKPGKCSKCGMDLTEKK